MKKANGYRPSFPTVISLVALFISLGSVAWAIDANSVKSKHIVNEQVKAADVKDDSLTGAEIEESSLDLSDTLGEAVVFFQGACPAGWADFGAAEGRYIVGVPDGGTLSNTIGTPLTDGEDRPVGEHDHGIAHMPHSHPYASDWAYADTADSGTTRRPLFDFKPADGDVPDVPSHGAAVSALDILNTGDVAGTNAREPPAGGGAVHRAPGL